MDEITKSVLNRLVTPNALKLAAKRASLDTARIPNVKTLDFDSVISAIEMLDDAEAAKTNGRSRKELLSKLDRKLRSLAPLNYLASKNPGKATDDLLQLALVSFAARISSLPKGVRCFATSNSPLTFQLQHSIANVRFTPFQLLPWPKKLAWLTTSLLGAAYVLENGYPFVGMDREVVLYDQPKQQSADSKVWILFRVALGEKHCTVEVVAADDGKNDLVAKEDSDENIEGEFLARNELIRVYDVAAMNPLLIRFAST